MEIPAPPRSRPFIIQRSIIQRGLSTRIPIVVVDPATYGEAARYVGVVMAEVMHALVRFCPGLPDVRKMSVSELLWWYDGIRPLLRGRTAIQ